MFIGGVKILISGREGEHDGINARNIARDIRQRQRCPHAHAQWLPAGGAFQCCLCRPQQGMRSGQGIGISTIARIGDGEFSTFGAMGAQMSCHGFTRLLGILPWHQAHGKLGMRQRGNDGLAARAGIAAPHAIHIKCRAQPKPFKKFRRGVMTWCDSDGCIMLRHIEGNARQFCALFVRSY